MNKQDSSMLISNNNPTQIMDTSTTDQRFEVGMNIISSPRLPFTVLQTHILPYLCMSTIRPMCDKLSRIFPHETRLQNNSLSSSTSSSSSVPNTMNDNSYGMFLLAIWYRRTTPWSDIIQQFTRLLRNKSVDSTEMQKHELIYHMDQLCKCVQSMKSIRVGEILAQRSQRLLTRTMIFGKFFISLLQKQ